jgi:hypothetical protein
MTKVVMAMEATSDAAINPAVMAMEATSDVAIQ